MNDSREAGWKDIIVDHSQFPRHHGRMQQATHEGRGENPFCGDRVHLQLQIDGQGRISNACFEATGCAISLASASMLASSVLECDVSRAEKLFRAVHAMLTGEPQGEDVELGELEALSLVRRYPSRVKCASLVWHVLRNTLQGEAKTATTE